MLVEAALADTAAQPGVAKPDPILVVDGVQRRYGGLVAVDVEHLEVQRGVITSLIGPNGAGKTTFFNLLCGFDRADAGSWTFEGERADGVSPHVLARRGMVRTFQLTKTLARLTVLDNVLLAAPNQKGERFLAALARPRWSAQEAENRERAHDLLVRFKLDHLADEFAAGLSGGQRKLLEMARSLMAQPEPAGPRHGLARRGHLDPLRRARHGRDHDDQ